MERLSMEPVYIFTWDNISANAYTYGSQITYPESMSVQYQNRLQPSGRPLYTWASLRFDAESATRQNNALPILEPGVSYHLILDMEVTPAQSVGINIEFFDYDGRWIDQYFGVEQNLDFVYPEQAADYKISLVKFNNEQVIFKALILLKTEFQNKYALNWYHNDQVISFTHKQDQQPFDQVSIILKYRYQPVDTVYVHSNAQATYNIEMAPMSSHQIKPFVHELLDELKIEWAQTTQIEVNGIGLGTAEVVEEFKQSWQTTIR